MAQHATIELGPLVLNASCASLNVAPLMTSVMI
eukprot:CAMPEP_0177198558 /NCGR_PEP_ID=MMETSP0367-20130122/25196_1 /TAXON_ID=447022 ORGANISM="Scrippsiella hangoei-like, Strain SHHI-4" /NCGR_SAMPLE_ID=MMETSP0367 /ASSEMBLY_ACC=CAM_ASM_000362 /LENGTH=32 /DNA_ID= /DNA_START= /DNA_END= /DNA_ORIENTATION=